MKCSTRMSLSFLAAGVLLSSSLAAAQPAAAPPQLTGIAHVALRVSDVNAELRFFGKLGFQEAFTGGGNGSPVFTFIKINDREFIEVHPPVGAAGSARQPLGFMHVCFEATDVKAVNAGYAAAGLRPTPVVVMSDGSREFSVNDPEGRVTEVLQYMPGSKPVADSGQHLGPDRVSDELTGFDLPVANVAAMAKFYQSLGFEAESDDVSTRLSLPANPDVRMVLRAAQPSSRPRFFLPIDNAGKIADELRKAGLQVVRDKKLVFVLDPDGNTFVLLETGDHTPRHQ